MQLILPVLFTFDSPEPSVLRGQRLMRAFVTCCKARRELIQLQFEAYFEYRWAIETSDRPISPSSVVSNVSRRPLHTSTHLHSEENKKKSTHGYRRTSVTPNRVATALLITAVQHKITHRHRCQQKSPPSYLSPVVPRNARHP